MVSIQNSPRVARTPRAPAHNWQVEHAPYVIQPCLIAPVLAGETMKNMLMQARVVTDPVKHPLLGWWIEYYFFYVKLTDLDERDTITNALVDPTASMSSLNSAAAQSYYHAAGLPNWSEKCLKRVVEDYFRDEGEAWTGTGMTYTGGMPIAQIQGNSWADSAMLASDMTVADMNVDLNANSTITASEVEKALYQWNLIKANNLMDMSFEDYLRSFGVRVPEEASRRPELIRYVRDWQYPTNTVEPTTGIPTSAVSWAVTERADKDRFFREPGFIFGVTVARPKVYLSGQKGSAVDQMNNAYAWLPATMRDQIASSILTLTAANSILTGASASWIFDVKDLLLYGDQFINVSLSATDKGLVALPTSTFRNRYVAPADIDALFSGTAKQIRQDGVVRFSILGAQTETTPRGNTSGFVI